MQKFTEATNATINLLCFNHTAQSHVNFYIDDSEELQELVEWMQENQQEITVEQVIIDGEDFPSLANFSKLTKYLEDILSLIEEYNVDQVSDFLSNFSLEDLDSFEDAYTGSDDFKVYAQEVADDLLSGCNNDLATRYFDYDAFERDLSHDYYIGRYVWRSV